MEYEYIEMATVPGKIFPTKKLVVKRKKETKEPPKLIYQTTTTTVKTEIPGHIVLREMVLPSYTFLKARESNPTVKKLLDFLYNNNDFNIKELDV